MGNSQLVTIIGIAAGLLTSTSLIPQLVKICKTKKAEDVSLFMLFILLAGVCLWIVYGCMKKDLPIILTNSFSVVINCCILGFRIKYSGNKD
jgi:MtN3 and saliva related transmembrane protein